MFKQKPGFLCGGWGRRSRGVGGGCRREVLALCGHCAGVAIIKKKKLGVSNTPYDGGRWVTDGGWWVTDGGWCVTDGGWWVTDGGWWVATKHQRVAALVKKKKRLSVLMATPGTACILRTQRLGYSPK